MLAVTLLALLVFLSVVVRLAERVRPDGADAGDDPSPAQRLWARLRRGPQKPPLPEGHRPPAGLGPLSPSERFLQSEAERGLRALQAWLLDQTPGAGGRAAA